MTLKAKLISSILAFIMVASLMMVGIFASPTVTLQMGGNVSFSANGVYADITGNIVGTQDHPTGSPLQLSTISIDYTNTETEVDLSGENSDWTAMPLTFDENGSEITVTMNIQNKASDRAIKVTITDNTNIENVTVERAYNSTTFASNTDTRTINGGQNGSYTFKLSVNSQNSPASGSFSLDVKLESTENVEPAQKYNATLTYTDQTYYARGNDGVVHTISDGDSIEMSTSFVSIALNQSYFQSASNSLSNIEIIDSENRDDIELYSVGEPGSFDPRLFVGDDKVAHYDSVSNKWREEIQSSSISKIEISDDGQVVTLYLAADCNITIDREDF